MELYVKWKLGNSNLFKWVQWDQQHQNGTTVDIVLENIHTKQGSASPSGIPFSEIHKIQNKLVNTRKILINMSKSAVLYMECLTITFCTLQESTWIYVLVNIMIW